MSAMAKREPRSDAHRRQRAKNIALAAALVGFIVLIYFVTIVRMSGN